MPDNNTGLNAQYGASQFGLDTSAYASTGAAGSPSAGDSPPGAGGGPVIASPVVSVPYASSQIPASMPRIPVVAGDTTASSTDTVIPPRGDPMTGLSEAQVTTTGAGLGTAEHMPHPNSMSGR